MLPIDSLALRFEPAETMLIATQQLPLSPVSPSLSISPFDLSQCGDSDLGLFLSQRMELVWHGEFDRLFSQYYPQAWYLIPTFYAPSDRWQVFKDSAKVRFSCNECGHGWTSMKGRVIFWFHLNFATNAGYVLFKLYGQQCQKCNNGKFEHAMWYPEEVVKVVGNVYNRVGQCYYGFVRPPLRIDRRQGKPRNQHNAELCQACKEGLCREEWAVANASSSASSSS
ncbi:receptor-transporting protein 4-like isoform X2 [Babylonia areolata]|uniref:receptor-transporting protein 4-like isoform X2 n=1 Tax=Babylonia areolata TaxID=304850 RepID=UPI003FD2F6BB